MQQTGRESEGQTWQKMEPLRFLPSEGKPYSHRDPQTDRPGEEMQAVGWHIVPKLEGIMRGPTT